MSLCLLIQDRDRIIVAGDSRESIKIKGEYFATGGEFPKIRVIGDQVIFSTGNSYVANSILRDYEESGIYSIDNLQKIKDKHVEKYIASYGGRFYKQGFEKRHIVGLVVSSYRNGKSLVQTISSKDSEVFESVGDTIRAADGVRCSEALELLKEYERKGGQDLLEGYRYVYNSLADESIGGTMYIFHVDASGIRRGSYPITDSREIKIAPVESLWSREEGLVVQSYKMNDNSAPMSKAVFNADEMYFEVGGQRKFWLDIPNETLKFAGTLEAADGIFSGDLSAVGGTFAGELQAASGSFTGELQAATGTFTGELVAASGTFAGELQAASGTFTGELQAATGSFSGEITATSGFIGGWAIGPDRLFGQGVIEGGTIIGASIRTSNNAFPRIELNSIGNLLAAYQSPSNYIAIVPSYNSDPTIGFYSGGQLQGSISNESVSDTLNMVMDGHMLIRATEGLKLQALLGKVQFLNWDNVQSQSSGQTLQQELNNLYLLLSGRATSGASTSTSGSHNHGIPDGTRLMTADGGTVTFHQSGAHSHTQT